ncbi:MAG: hypothetical protein NC548_55250 [Lachnospiraceae bacterium]|nr:hypothetical protein [Lachnospiraceae bacterium]
MQKIKNVKEYVEKLDAAKKVNPKDLSSDQDLTIGIMNLISIEEHLMFSGAKTGKTEFYDMINEVRDMRKRMMQKIIPSYEGEVWCISKHLLASAMRLFEVGTKALASGDTDTAYSLFDDSYGLYCIFWGLNMGMLNGENDVKYVKPTSKPTKQKKDVAIEPVPTDGTVSKLKTWVKNAVNCCIE